MKTTAVMLGLFAGLLFGIATPFSKALLSQLNSFQLAGLLYLGAAIAFLPFILKNWKTELNLLKISGKKSFLAGSILLGGILGPLFLMLGLKIANASSVSIWLNMELAATALLGILFFKDYLDLYALFGVVLTLCAGILISVEEANSGMLSGFFILLACISWGFDNHFTAMIDNVSPKTITFVKGVFGGLTNISLGLVFSQGHIQSNYILFALLLGILSYGISIVLYVIAAQNLGATRSQILFSTAPFWGIFGAFLFLGEPLTVNLGIAVSLLLIGIVFTQKAAHEHEHFHKNMTHTHWHSHDDEHHDHPHQDSSDKRLKHSHPHQHNAITHAHRHYPDIHHRHGH